jgi:hypothetical protein
MNFSEHGGIIFALPMEKMTLDAPNKEAVPTGDDPA